MEFDKLSSPEVDSTSRNVDPVNALSFFRTVGKLKQLKRTGWVNHGIPLPESVADHMYRMSMITFLVQDPAVDKDKLMKICMVHDLAEAIVGDITPHDGVSKEEKRRLEESAMKKILSEVGDERISSEIMLLWLTYEEGDSLEADLARQLDKLEMIIQANEYECLHPEQRLDSFFRSTADSFRHPQILEWANALRKERDTRQQN
eukprot:gene34294-44297_t